MNKKLQVLKYLIADISAAMIAWTLFFTFRKIYIEAAKYGKPVPLTFDSKFFWGLAFIPFFWVVSYYLTGTYKDIAVFELLGTATYAAYAARGSIKSIVVFPYDLAI